MLHRFRGEAARAEAKALAAEFAAASGQEPAQLRPESPLIQIDLGALETAISRAA
jgi:hypothetical protein